VADATPDTFKHGNSLQGAPYTLPAKAEELYNHLTKYRQQVWYNAIDMAAVTIPSVYPPLGYRTGMNIDESNQSIGAMCVNTLASKLMFMALPPDRPVLRYTPIEHRLGQAIQQNPQLWTQIQIALNSLEQEHKSRLEATNIRSAYVGMVKHLLVGGNVCWEHMKMDSPVYHCMDTYVVKRNPQGEQLLVILKRCLNIMDLDQDVQDMVKRLAPSKFRDKKQEYEEYVDIYAVCKRCTDDKGNHYWEYWEEFEGELIPDTEYECDFEIPPLYAAWMIPVYGQNWGRSYCEEYRGDLYLVDGHSKAINDGAAMASLILMFLKAGSRTSAKQIKKAQNMSLMSGQADDLSAFKLDKTADFGFVNQNLESAVKRLGRAFLLVSSVQRDAERVTAEEWKEMAEEIDQATGGLYSELAQSIQRHVIRRAVALHNEEDKQLPKLPAGLIRTEVVTGIEAMGRTIEGQNLMRALQGYEQLYGPQALQENTDPAEALRRILVSENVKQDGLALDPQAAAQKKQQMQADAAKMTMLNKGTGPAIQAMGKSTPALGQAINQENADPGTPPPGNAPALPPQTGQA
jgi:hypothetical protein